MARLITAPKPMAVKAMALGSTAGPGAGVGTKAPMIAAPDAPAMAPVARQKGISKVPGRISAPKEATHPQSHADFMKLGA